MKKIFVIIFLLVGGIFNLSCSKLKSDETKTENWVANYEQEVLGDRITCIAKITLDESNSTFIELTGGDYLACGGVSMTRADSVVGEVIYKASMKYVPTKAYDIVLTRKNEGDYVARAEVPAAIDIISPKDGASLQKGSALDVNWLPSSSRLDGIFVSLTYEQASAGDSGSQYQAFAERMATESGRYVFSSNKTPKNIEGDVNGAATVPATLLLSRYRTGSMLSGLKGKITMQRSLNLRVFFN